MNGTTLLNSFLCALGLALEAIMVSLANGLNNANLRVLRVFGYALLFAVCHAVALGIGYAIVSSVSNNVEQIESVLTWVAVGVLTALGVKMIIEGVRHDVSKCENKSTRAAEFFIQSVVASFDAFAVGLTVPDYSIEATVICGVIIAAVITLFYVVGFAVGKRFGTKLGKYTAIIGGAVFIGMAMEIAVLSFI